MPAPQKNVPRIFLRRCAPTRAFAALFERHRRIASGSWRRACIAVACCRCSVAHIVLHSKAAKVERERGRVAAPRLERHDERRCVRVDAHKNAPRALQRRCQIVGGTGAPLRDAASRVDFERVQQRCVVHSRHAAACKLHQRAQQRRVQHNAHSSQSEPQTGIVGRAVGQRARSYAGAQQRHSCAGVAHL